MSAIIGGALLLLLAILVLPVVAIFPVISTNPDMMGHTILFMMLGVILFIPVVMSLGTITHTLYDNGVDQVEPLVEHEKSICGDVDMVAGEPSPEDGACNNISPLGLPAILISGILIYSLSVGVAGAIHRKV